METKLTINGICFQPLLPHQSDCLQQQHGQEDSWMFSVVRKRNFPTFKDFSIFRVLGIGNESQLLLDKDGLRLKAWTLAKLFLKSLRVCDGNGLKQISSLISLIQAISVQFNDILHDINVINNKILVRILNILLDKQPCFFYTRQTAATKSNVTLFSTRNITRENPPNDVRQHYYDTEQLCYKPYGLLVFSN